MRCKADKLDIVPLQFGPASIEFWSEGTWEWFLADLAGFYLTEPKGESETSIEATSQHKYSPHF